MTVNEGTFETSKCDVVMGTVIYRHGMYRQESGHRIYSRVDRHWQHMKAHLQLLNVTL